MKLIDMTGQIFNMILVLRKGGTRPSGMGGSNWVCRCDCGKEFVAVGSAIRSGKKKSCGCHAKSWASFMGSNPEYVAKRVAKNTRHGHKRTRKMSTEYRTWLGMKRRCYDPKFKDYPNWGGRGIRVCKEWLHDFVAFYAYMGDRPVGDYTIDRLDPDDHYRPGNVRWAHRSEQGQKHRRNLTRIAIGDLQFESIAEACRHFGVGLTTAHERIRAGVDLKIAVSHVGRLPGRWGPRPSAGTL